MAKKMIKGHKSLNQEINEIAEYYFFAMRKNSETQISDFEKEPNDYEKYIDRVERAFEQLTDIEKEFINNDFFYQAYPNWWKKYYSKSNYYRIRKRSMLSFKEAFEYEN